MLIEVTRPQLEFIAAYRNSEPEKYESFELFYSVSRCGEQQYLRLGGVNRPNGTTENNNPKHYRMWCLGFGRRSGKHMQMRKHYTTIVRLLEQQAVHAVIFNYEQVLRWATVYDAADLSLFYMRTEKFEISTEALW